MAFILIHNTKMMIILPQAYKKINKDLLISLLSKFSLHISLYKKNPPKTTRASITITKKHNQ